MSNSSVFNAVLIVLVSNVIHAQDSPKAQALVNRVVEARVKSDGLVLEFNLVGLGREGRCKLIFDGDQRVMVAKFNKITESTFWDGQSVWQYTTGGDVRKLSFQQASKVGVFCFDPRVIGVSASVLITHEIENMLLDGVEEYRLIGEEKMESASTFHVRLVRGSQNIDLWIDEAGARIYKKVHFSSGDTINNTVASSFPKHSEFESWIPSNVEATGPNGKLVMSDIKVVAKTKPEHLSLSELEIPNRTAVVDYVQNHRIGYWVDGKIVSDEEAFVEHQSLEYDATQNSKLLRPIMLAFPAVILVFGFIFWKLKSRSVANS